MNEVEEKLYCKEGILIKYSSLFKTYRLDIFNNRIKYLDEAIFKKYSDYISIFLYVKDKDNNILHTREIVYNPSMPKEKQFFFNKFENFRKYNYQFTSTSDMKKLFISYCIVPHEIDSNTTNYDNILGINEKFIKINSTQEKNTINVMFEDIKNNKIKSLTLMYSFISFVFILLVLSRMDSIPIQTIYFNILPLIISKFLFGLLCLFIAFYICMYYMFLGIKIVVFDFFPKKLIMKWIHYNNINILLRSLIFILGIYIIVVMLDNISPISSISTDYIFKTQTPKILKIQNKDTNTSENILYLGSDDIINYFTDKNINHLISENEKLYKKVCMGRDTGYIDHLMPLIEKKTFVNRVYRSVLKRDVHILPQNLTFQDTFCSTDYPKIVKKISKDKNETVLWMGLKYKQDSFSEAKDTNTSYYYSESQIHDMLKKNPQFEEYASNKDLWIKHIMREKALENVDYERLDDANFVDMHDVNISKEFYQKKY